MKDNKQSPSYIKKQYIALVAMAIAVVVNPCVALHHSHNKMFGPSQSSASVKKLERELDEKQDQFERHIKDHEPDIKKLNSNVKVAYQDIKEIHELQAKTLPKIEAKQRELMQSLKVKPECSCGDDNDNHVKTDADIQHPFKDASIYVFVSYSMNEKNIIDLGKEASKYGAHLVLRGFVDNSYIKTANIFQKFMSETGQGISVDPELFKTFAIDKVPTFVVARAYHLQNNDDNTQPMHDKLSGNVSLEYAIRKFKTRGSIAKQANTKRIKTK